MAILKKSSNQIRDYKFENELFMRRAIFAFGAIVIALLLLLTNLYKLQVLEHTAFQTRSNSNRIKVIPIAPNRGLIYDKSGIILAENRPVFTLEITPSETKNLKKTLKELQKLLKITPDEIKRFNKERRHTRRFKSTPIRTQLTPVEVAKFSVHQHQLPGVEVNAYLKRYYPYGKALTHVLGYVAKINDKDLKKLIKNDKAPNYAATHDIGKLGIEKYYENILHGKVGYQKVEVNSRGKIIRTLAYQPPTPGNDLVLNIDINLQLYVSKLLKNRRGAAIVIDPNTDAVLAMVSSPSYNPNLFVHGISSREYRKLLTNPDRPLVNRATLGIYPPASTVKPAMAVAALSEGVITAKTVYNDPGYWKIPNSTTRPFRDWKAWGHGKVNVYKALEESVDTYFYQVAYDMGIDRIYNWMHAFGFGDYTGIDIGEEVKANMPDRAWKLARYKKPWYQGDTIPVGIGQGYWTATPIQLAKALSVIINNGEVKAPHILKEIITPTKTIYAKLPQFKNIEGVKPKYWAIAREGMRLVNHGKKGTARRSFATAKYKTGGKSGTAQVFGLAENEKYNAEELDERLRDHALYISFAPFDKPQYALSLVLENAGGGSSHGAPIARKVFDFALLKEKLEVQE